MEKEIRLFVFIDGGYFYKSIVQTFGKIQYDIRSIIEKMAQERKIVGIRYYIGEINTHMAKNEKEKAYYKNQRDAQQKFLSRLKSSGIEYRLGYFNPFDNIEKSVDILLAMDLISLALDDEYDVALLITGDGDFLPAVELVQNKLGKYVINGAFKKRFSIKLMNRAKGFFFLDDKIA